MDDYRIRVADGAVFQVDAAGKRHILPAEWAELAKAGFSPIPIDPAALDAIPDAVGAGLTSPPPAMLQYLEDHVAALNKYLAAVKPPTPTA